MPSDDALTTARLITEIQSMAGQRCPHCDEPVTLREALNSRALGSRRRPKCMAGLAELLGSKIDDLESQLTDYFELRDCYGGALEWIQRQ